MEYTRDNMTAGEAQCLSGRFPFLLGDITGLGWEAYNKYSKMRDDMFAAGFIERLPSGVKAITERGQAAMEKALSPEN